MNSESLSPNDLFALMDEVTVRRSRPFVRDHYPDDRLIIDGVSQVITFPEPDLAALNYQLDPAGLDLIDAVVNALDPALPFGVDPRTLHSIRLNDPDKLMLSRYLSSAYLKAGALADAYQLSHVGLLKSMLLKRLESSPAALLSTLRRLIVSHQAFLNALDNGHVLTGSTLADWAAAPADMALTDLLDQLAEDVSHELADQYRVPELRADITSDIALLERLGSLAEAANMPPDPKTDSLIGDLRATAEAAAGPHPKLSPGDRRKTVVFTEFVDTALDLHQRLSEAVAQAEPGDPLAAYQDRIAPVAAGSVDRASIAGTAARFSPDTAETKDRQPDLYDILITTDVLAEGVNLHQAARVVNFDLPWNPTRLIQRYGRVDRIGTRHDTIYLRSFIPDQRLDTLLNLMDRLSQKLARANAAVGHGEVLPGTAAGDSQDFSDTIEPPEPEHPHTAAVRRLLGNDKALIDDLADSQALSGENLRLILRDAIPATTDEPPHELLPYGAGSGFESNTAGNNAYVFCIKVGDNPDAVFCTIPVDHNWELIADRDQPDNPAAATSRPDIALIAANPHGQPRHLPTDPQYRNAYAAWETARSVAHAEHTKLADPTSAAADIPRVMLDAINYIHEHAADTQTDDWIEATLDRYDSTPDTSTQRQIRAVLNSTADHHIKIGQLGDIADTNLPLKPDPAELPKLVAERDMRLICWTAITASP